MLAGYTPPTHSVLGFLLPLFILLLGLPLHLGEDRLGLQSVAVTVVRVLHRVASGRRRQPIEDF